MGLFRKRAQSELEKALTRKEMNVVKDYIDNWAKASGKPEAKEAAEMLKREGALTAEALDHLQMGLMIQMSGQMTNPYLASLGGARDCFDLKMKLLEIKSAKQENTQA